MNTRNSGFDWFFRNFFKVWAAVVVVGLILTFVIYGAIAAAVYWGLSIADRAVDDNAPQSTHQVLEE